MRFRSRQAKISGILLLVCSVVILLIVVLSPPIPPDLDGQWIAFTCVRNPGHDSETTLHIVRTDGSEVQELVSGDRITDPAWSPDGEWIAYDYGDEIQIIRANRTGRRSVVENGFNASPIWSPNSQEIVYVAGFIAFDRLRLDDGHRTEIGRFREPGPGMSWSPGGEWIVFEHSGTLYLLATDGSGQIEPIPLEGNAMHPTLSPDGEWVAFFYWDNDGEELGLNMMKVDGSDLTQITSEHGNSPTWSPDGEWIAFAHVIAPGISEIIKVRSDGSDLQQITHLGDCSPATAPTWSPDFGDGS